MLPILPALLLLLLHGPSNVERLAREGRLPAGLEAVRKEMAHVSPASQSRNQAAIVAMLTGHDPCLTQALIGLLQPDETEPEAATAKEPRPASTALEPAAKPPAEGFSDCRRSRDGPRVIA